MVLQEMIKVTERSKQIIDSLNDVQKRAALFDKGPIVVFAGAGSGKTRIITSRIALLLENGIRPSQIFAVTFTNKAAKEMRERAIAMCPDSSGVHIATFHSACARWLREFAPELGFSSDFTIFDDNDVKSLMKRILKEMGVKLDGKYTANDYKAAVARVKTYGWLPSEAEKQSKNYADIFPPHGVKLYKKYQESLALQNAMDFSDLLLNMLLLLRTNIGVRKLLQTRYKYILVDEYQDTNPTQFELISYLVNEDQNLMVVGDDDQSIYSWRGADPTNIIEFNKHYPKAEIVRLEQNYRCAGNIVDAASAVIRNNKMRAEKTLWTENEKGEPIDFCLEHDGESESWYVIDQIKSEKETFEYEDIAIFYRTNAQSRQLEDILRRNVIPYQIFGSLRFYDRAEIKDLLAYIRLLVNPKDDAAFLRIVNVPARGIGKKAQDDLSLMAEQNKVSIFEMARQVVENKVPRLSAKISPFIKLMDTLKIEVDAASVADTVSILLDHVDYRSHLEKKFPEQVEDKMANVHELGAALSSYAEEFPDHKLNRWLQDVSLQGSEEESHGGVTLMTLHSAKGLEFNRVYLVGFEDGLLPHTNSMDYEDDLEEERRLLYVGMTRAKVKLTLTGARKRRVFNNWMANSPSRFLAEIPTDILQVFGTSFSQGEMFEETGYDQITDPEAFHEEYASEPVSYTVGMKVSHPTYGSGSIESIDNEYGVIKAIVEFNDFGKRKVTVSQLESNTGYSDGKDDELEYSYD